MVGPSGHLTKPAGGTLAAYTRCVPASSEVNRHVKVVANLQYVLRAGDDPHSFVYQARRCLLPSISIRLSPDHLLQHMRIPSQQASHKIPDVRGSASAA